jgi:hypothetical protein
MNPPLLRSHIPSTRSDHHISPHARQHAVHVHKRKCTLNKARLKACKRGVVSEGMIIYIFTRPCGAPRAAIVAASTQATATMLATMVPRFKVVQVGFGNSKFKISPRTEQSFQ